MVAAAVNPEQIVQYSPIYCSAISLTGILVVFIHKKEETSVILSIDYYPTIRLKRELKSGRCVSFLVKKGFISCQMAVMDVSL